jgi:uncharacterized protein YodC (DUF2158 family)
MSEINDEFKTGDIVSLKSGSIIMTAETISDNKCDCTWYDEARGFQKSTFYKNALINHSADLEKDKRKIVEQNSLKNRPLYKKVLLGPEKFILENDETMQSVCTYANNFGGKFQIAIDDGCYVVYCKTSIYGDRYKPTAWLFP